MKIQTKQKYVLLAGMTGFVLGICSANLWMKEYILDIGIFNQFFLEQYNRLEIVYEEYFWYLIKNRGVFLLILTAAAGTKDRKSAVILTVIWLGFCVGMVICTAIARLGIKGIVLCVIAVMPQGVFYILSGILLFEYMLEYPVVRWNSGKTIKLIMLVLLGMITECYVNPVIIRMFLKTL